MSKVVLDINKKPPVKTYNHHAFGTGIITSIEQGKNWMYNNYIQLSFYPKDGPLTFDFYMDYIYNQPVFDMEYFSEETSKMLKWNPVKLFVNALDRDRYVECCVDEYFIPEREAYMRYHFRHNILIYGYDDCKKEFYTIGYDDTGKYCEHIVAFKQMVKAKPIYIHLLKLRKELDYELDVNYIEHQIKQYNDEIPIEPVGSYPKDGRYVGVNAVNALCDYICDCVSNEEAIDIRPISVLMEHRRLMLERYQTIGLKIDNKQVIQEIKKQVEECEKLRNRVMMYNSRQSDKDATAILELQSRHRDVRMPKIQ